MPTPPQVLDASLALVRDRKVGGNAHPSMLRGRFISASRLVQRTAKDLIAEVLRDEPRDPREAHWGEDGNAKAAINLQHVRCQEPTLALNVTDAWRLTGHPDGVDVSFATEDGGTLGWAWRGGKPSNSAGATGYVTVYENKAPMFEPGDAKVELYYRQGLLYLAMLVQMHEDDVRSLAPAEWLDQDDRRCRPWPLPEELEPAQVVVCIQPSVAEKREQAFPVDRPAIFKHLAAYMEKAKVIIRGVEAKDPEVGVREWDSVKDKGLGEFALKGSIPDLTTDEDVFDAVTKRAAAAARVKKEQEVVDTLTAALEAHLRARGVPEAQVGDYRVVLQPVKGGIRHFTVEDRVDLRVYGGSRKKALAVPTDPVAVEVRA